MPIFLAAGKTLGEIMKEAVLPQDENFLGLGVNPSFFSALIVTCLLLLGALLIRIFAVPRFKDVPGKFQSAIEWVVELFSGIAKQNSPHRNAYLGAFNFSAGVYIFFSTMIELLGLRAVFADINACIALALCAFGTIMAGAIRTNGLKGALGVMKDFSLPLSMTFRLYGSMLSGLLMTDLVYQFLALSFIVPAIVGVMFTVFHAVIQCLILVMLTSMFYGESAEKKEKKSKKNRSEAQSLSDAKI